MVMEQDIVRGYWRTSQVFQVLRMKLTKIRLLIHYCYRRGPMDHRHLQNLLPLQLLIHLQKSMMMVKGMKGTTTGNYVIGLILIQMSMSLVPYYSMTIAAAVVVDQEIVVAFDGDVGLRKKVKKTK